VAVEPRERVGQDRRLVLEVVEGDDHVGDHQRHLRHLQLVRVRVADGRLGVADQVVAEHADRAARERRQVGQLRGAVLLELAGDCKIGVRPHVLHFAAYREYAVLKANRGPRLHAQERPAAHALALLGGLEQERRAVAAQLQVGRHRGLDVVDVGVSQRHDRVVAGQPSHLVETRADVELGGSGAWDHGAILGS
jgi:hypothetical protein